MTNDKVNTNCNTNDKVNTNTNCKYKLQFAICTKSMELFELYL